MKASVILPTYNEADNIVNSSINSGSVTISAANGGVVFLVLTKDSHES